MVPDKWTKRFARRWTQPKQAKSLQAMGLTLDDAIAIERYLMFGEPATLSNGEQL